MEGDKEQIKQQLRQMVNESSEKHGLKANNFKSFANFKQHNNTLTHEQNSHNNDKQQGQVKRSQQQTEYQSNKRWEELYKLNERILKVKEARAKELERKLNQVEEECTFQPNILPSSKKIIHEHFGPIRPLDNPDEFYERKKEWEAKRSERLKALQEQEIVRESQKCTFKPQIEPKASIPKPKQALEIDQSETTRKFLERQTKARQLAEEKKKALSFRKDYVESDKRHNETKTRPNPSKINDDFVRESIIGKPFSDAVSSLHLLLNSIEPKSYSMS
jgi:hypothetical protein